jgi:hypothetical protein
VKPFIALCVAVLFSPNALGENSEMLWVMPVARVCIAQDPAYGQTLLGRWVMQGRLNIKSSEFDVCARRKNWVPHPMCDELMSLDPESTLSERNLERLRMRHRSELQGLNVAGEYVTAFEKAESQGAAAPSCPPEETATRAASRRFDIFAGSNDANLNAMSEPVRNVNVWRLTPGVLLARCATEAPEREPSMHTAHDAWRQTNESLIARVDQVIDRVAPLYAGALVVSESDARNRIAAFTTDWITGTYLKNDKTSASCANYDKTIAGLSSPGQVATIRGFVYAVEAMLAARKSERSDRIRSTGEAPK